MELYNHNKEDLRIRAEQAKMDAEVTQKIAQSQHELVDSIEDHVERSTEEVRNAHQQLQKAVEAKNAKYPLIAATLGSLTVGGPVGVAAGSAIAGAAAAVGGAFAGLFLFNYYIYNLGLYAGRIFKKQVQPKNN